MAKEEDAKVYMLNPLNTTQLSRHRRVSGAFMDAGDGRSLSSGIELPEMPEEPERVGASEGKTGQQRTTSASTQPSPRKLASVLTSLHQGVRATREGDAVRVALSQGSGGSRSLGLPVGSLLQHIYVMERDRSMVTSCGFLMYLLAFVVVMTSIYNVHEANGVNVALSDLFLDEEFPGAQYKKNFHEIMTMEEWWDWLEGPVLAGAYPQQWYNGQPMNGSEKDMLLYNLKRVGGVQLRQMRVRRDSCTASGQQAARGGASCFPHFSSMTQDTAAFGPGKQWAWSDGHHSMDGLFGYAPVQGYGKGGYITLLNATDAGAAAAEVAALKEGRWLDEGTRAVSVMFNLYNSNTCTVTVVRLLVEFFGTGHIVKSYKFHTMRQAVYHSAADFVRAGGEVMFVVMFLGYLMHTGWHLVRAPHMKLLRIATVYEVTMHVLVGSVLVQWVWYLLDDQRVSFDFNSTKFSDLYDTSERYIQTFTLASFAILMYCLNFFRFFSINKRLNTLWLTLYEAAPDLAAFTLGFIILVSGFAILAQYTFGSLLPNFHNFTSSFSTLLRFPLGDFQYDDLSNTRPQVTGIFFAAYVAMVFLVCMNMIIGIISLYFEEVHQALKAEDPWMRSAPPLAIVLQERLRLMWHHIQVCVSRQRSFPPATQHLINQAAFRAQLERAAGLTLLHSSVEFKAYLDSVYRQVPSGVAVYIGEYELCKLMSSAHAGEAGGCRHTTCAASKLLAAFSKLGSTTLVGAVKRNDGFKHLVAPVDAPSSSGFISTLMGCLQRPVATPAAARPTISRRKRRSTATDRAQLQGMATEDSRLRFMVQKVTRTGWQQPRLMFLDTRSPSEPLVQLYDVMGRLRKEYDVTLLSQVHVSGGDPSSVTLFFHTAGKKVALVAGATGGASPTSGMASGNPLSPTNRKKPQKAGLAEGNSTTQGTSTAGTSVVRVKFEELIHASAFTAALGEAVDSMHAMQAAPSSPTSRAFPVSATPTGGSDGRGTSAWSRLRSKVRSSGSSGLLAAARAAAAEPPPAPVPAAAVAPAHPPAHQQASTASMQAELARLKAVMQQQDAKLGAILELLRQREG